MSNEPPLVPSQLFLVKREILERTMAALVEAAQSLVASPRHYLNLGCVDPEAGRRQADLLRAPIKRTIYANADGTERHTIESSRYVLSGLTVEWQWNGSAPTLEEIERARNGHHHQDDYFSSRE